MKDMNLSLTFLLLQTVSQTILSETAGFMAHTSYPKRNPWRKPSTTIHPNIPFSPSSLHPSRAQVQDSPDCELQVVTSRTLPMGRRVRKEELERILSLLQADMQMQINWLIVIQNVQHPFKRSSRLCFCLSASLQDTQICLCFFPWMLLRRSDQCRQFHTGGSGNFIHFA